MPAATCEPIEQQHEVAYDEQGQDIDEHGPGRVSGWGHVAAEESKEREAHHEEGGDEEYKRKIFVDS
jgi:hypothetical protein